MPEFEDAREMKADPQAVWRVVSDPQRLAEWVPTAVSSQPAGEDTVELKGESHGHDYDMLGRFVTDDAAHELFWYSPRQNGYRGSLTVLEHQAGSLVTLRVVIPEDLRAAAEAEVTRGLGETLDRIEQLTTA